MGFQHGPADHGRDCWSALRLGRRPNPFVRGDCSGHSRSVLLGSTLAIPLVDLISATDASGEQTYFTHDGLGSVTDLTDDTGAVTATYAYDVFGALRAQTGVSDTYWQFAGEQTDAATGFQYLRARYYDPATGRFVTRDPLQGTALNPQTHNSYAYGLNNPVNRIDPRGLASESVTALPFLSLTGTEIGEFLYRLASCPDAMQFWVFGAALLIIGGQVGNVYLVIGGGLSLLLGWYIYQQSCVPRL